QRDDVTVALHQQMGLHAGTITCCSQNENVFYSRRMASIAEPAELEVLDLSDPDNWVEQVPHDGFDWLRENDPVSCHVMADGADFYALTRYQDVVRSEEHTSELQSRVDLVC